MTAKLFHRARFPRRARSFAEYRRQQGPPRPAEIGQLARVVQGGRTLHRIDAPEGEAYRDDPAVSAQRSTASVSARR